MSPARLAIQPAPARRGRPKPAVLSTALAVSLAAGLLWPAATQASDPPVLKPVKLSPSHDAQTAVHGPGKAAADSGAVEAAGSGETLVVTDTNTHQVDLTLAKFLELLPSERFQRISRINVINAARILRVNREDRTVDIEQGSKHKSLGVGDSYYTEMMKNLPVAKGIGGKNK